MSRAVKSTSLRALGLVLASAFLLTPGSAGAFELEGAVFVTELELPDDDGELTRRNPNEEDVKDHFNFANCVCGEAVNFGVRVTLEGGPTTYATTQNVEFWTGSSCDSTPQDIDTVRALNCELSDGSIDDAETLLNEIIEFSVPVKSLLSPVRECGQTEVGTRQVYAIIDEGTPGIEEGDIAEVLLDVPFDLQPPPAPNSIEVLGAEAAIQINWDLPDSRADDIRFFQVLCARADGTVNEADGFPSTGPEYLTSRMACESEANEVVPLTVVGVSALGPQFDAGPSDPDAGLPDAGTPDAGAGPDGGFVDPNLPQNLLELNPDFICGGAAGTDSQIRISGLENDVPYHIVLLAIDNYRNVAALDLGVATPLPVEDGWEHYKENGGNADGGYCFVATATYGNYDHPFVKILRVFRDDTLAHFAWGRGFINWYYDNSPALAGFIEDHAVARAVSYLLLAPLVAFAAVWEYTGPLGKLALLLAFGLLIRMRRQRRAERALGTPNAAAPHSRGRRLALAASAAVALLAFSATANAQAYWEDYNEEVQLEAATPRWNFELKVGPYSPNVDASAGGMTPFANVFGDKWKIMTIFGLDRYFAFPSGQLGITGTFGFSNRSAKAFSLGEDGQPYEDEDGNLVRSSGDSTSFRLMPTSVGVVYRFTRLDDDYGIPIVPYGKLALAYYLWWFTDPNGDTSETPTAACPDAGMAGSTCDGNFGRGGSFGYQATLGLAVRAERLDPGAELSLRTEMGIEHAGFFVEIQLADVDGFGASDKLSVGDTTWFGGINFEF
tara:strand:+ start:147818 stop:150166 length:2349 start_codon:yes stop_codon:yes gene_type:complete